MYTREFANDPHAVYDYILANNLGPLVPVWMAEGVPATLVTRLDTAVRILHDPEHFPADPRRWEKNLRATYSGRLDFLPMVEWRPNALRSNGNSPEHKRYREATKDALAGVNQLRLREIVKLEAHPLINAFCGAGATAEQPLDLIKNYIEPLIFTVLNRMVGSPPEIMARIAKASSDLFEGQDTAATNAQLDAALLDLTALKRAEPADDITTRLVQHPAGLDDTEMIHQLVTCLSAGTQIPVDLTGSTLLLILAEPKFRGLDGLEGVSLTTEAALKQILATDPPLANYCITYPRQPILVDNVWLPADEPVITSMVACSSSPDVNNGDHYSDGWHLAWGIGPHECPHHAQTASTLIVEDAINWLLDIVPEIELAVPLGELQWRPGPFARGLESLPITFPPTAPQHLD